jgi:hypothetical protein
MTIVKSNIFLKAKIKRANYQTSLGYIKKNRDNYLFSGSKSCAGKK